MSFLDKLKARNVAQAKEQAKIPTVDDFVREFDERLAPEHKPYGMRFLITRALTYHPNITRKVWETRVLYNPDLRTTAGRFMPRASLIEMHPGHKFADRRHLKETFLHELAHAMEWYAYRKGGHGQTWYEMMHILAQKPERTHNIDECKQSVFYVEIDKIAANLEI